MAVHQRGFVFLVFRSCKQAREARNRHAQHVTNLLIRDTSDTPSSNLRYLDVRNLKSKRHRRYGPFTECYLDGAGAGEEESFCNAALISSAECESHAGLSFDAQSERCDAKPQTIHCFSTKA